jgi:hypothetical protein
MYPYYHQAARFKLYFLRVVYSEKNEGVRGASADGSRVHSEGKLPDALLGRRGGLDREHRRDVSNEGKVQVSAVITSRPRAYRCWADSPDRDGPSVRGE